MMHSNGGSSRESFKGEVSSALTAAASHSH
jgi:hypothetical protein